MRTAHRAPARDLPAGPGRAAAWAVMLLGLGAGPVAGALVACVAAALACLRRRSPVLLAAAGTAAAAGIVIAAHTFLVASHPLHDQALRGAAATLRVVLRDDPRTLRTSGQPGPAAARVVVPAELVATTAGAGSWHGRGPGAAARARRGLAAAVARSERHGRGSARPSRAQRPHDRGAAGAGSAARRRRSAVVAVRRRWAALGPAGRHGHARARRGRAAARSGRRRHQHPHPEVDDDFRAAGLTHLLAVSGANLAILTGAVLARAPAAAGRSAVVGGGGGRGLVGLRGSRPAIAQRGAGSRDGSGHAGGARRRAARAPRCPRSPPPCWCCCSPIPRSPSTPGSRCRWRPPPRSCSWRRGGRRG